MNINDDVAALRELLAKATPGPWTRKKPEIVKSGPGEGWPSMSAVAATPGRQTIYAACDRGSFPSADCDLIVAMRNALPALLDDREAMRAQCEKMILRAGESAEKSAKLRVVLADAVAWIERLRWLPGDCWERSDQDEADRIGSAARALLGEEKKT